MRDALQQKHSIGPKTARWPRRAAMLIGAAIAILPALLILVPALPVSAESEMIVRSIAPTYPDGEPNPPTISAKAAILMDADSGRILFSHAANVRLPMASTTKIMTAIVALETLDLSDSIRISTSAASTYGSLFGLVPGEHLTVEELLYGLLVLSGNDVAVALAEASAGSVSAFVSLMNQKAKDLGLKNTHFVNANGLNADGHYSSAKDLAALTMYAMQNPVFCRIVNTAQYVALRPGPDGEPAERVIKNHNLLLGEYPWVTGVKTGSTPYAKYCLVFSGCRDGLSLVGVILGAKDDETRWKEAKAILNYGYDVSPRTILIERGETVLSLDVGDSLGRELRLVSDNALVSRLFKDDRVVATARVTRTLTLPVQAGDVFGSLEFALGGNRLGSTKLLAAEPVASFTIGMVMADWQRKWPPGLPLGVRFSG